jgi:hypothetical protein
MSLNYNSSSNYKSARVPYTIDFVVLKPATQNPQDISL